MSTLREIKDEAEDANASLEKMENIWKYIKYIEISKILRNI